MWEPLQKLDEVERIERPTGYKAPEIGNPPRRGGTERCLLGEEIPRNEAYIKVRRNKHPAKAGEIRGMRAIPPLAGLMGLFQ
jgi:hypothetical protein